MPRTKSSSACRPGNIEDAARQFQALADPTRLMLLCRLLNAPGELRVSDLSDCCGVHLSGVSRHLAIMRDAGLVEARKVGRTVFYGLRDKPLIPNLRAWADAVEAKVGESSGV